MAENIKNRPEFTYEDIPAEKFARVERESAIKDEKFETEPVGFFKDMLRRLCKNKAAIGALVIILIIVFMAIVGPMMNEYTYSEQYPEFVNMPPRIPVLEDWGIFMGTTVLKSRRVSGLTDTNEYPEGCIVSTSNPQTIRNVEVVDVKVKYYQYIHAEDKYFWFGTDNLGRDIWTRLWDGARVSLVIAVVAVFTNIIIGIIYGAIAGFYGGKLDMFMMRFCEIIRALPQIVVVTMFMLFFGTGMQTLILAMVLRGWVPTARMIRAQFLRFKGREYVMAARTMGVPDRKLIFRHILPNSIGPIITRAMVAIPGAIFTESFLAYIGLGLAAPQPSVGTMLAAGQKTLLLYPTQTLFPAILISVLMIAFNLFSNGLRDACDPTQRGVE